VLFEQAPKFRGLPEEGFGLFAIPDRVERRRRILDTIHPALKDLGEDLVERLSSRASERFHAHLPRLDWPRGYEPFATWLALSQEAHGYQAGPQFNLGVHADHVAVRLGWDATADHFGRFEFLCRHGELGAELCGLAASEGYRFRVFAAAPWPDGSKLTFESAEDVAGSFDEVGRRGVWWEFGARHEIPEDLPLVCSAEFGAEVARIFLTLLPVYERFLGREPPQD